MATDGVANTDFTMRTRSVITVDTRQQTEYGVLRTYFLIGHTGDSPTAEGLYANRGFIQFAGFTVGLAQSFFDFYSSPIVTYFATHSEDTGDGGWRVAAFTANFGNGISSTVSLEEPRRTSIINTSFAGQTPLRFSRRRTNFQQHSTTRSWSARQRRLQQTTMPTSATRTSCTTGVSTRPGARS